MIISIDDLPSETLSAIIRENIVRGADTFEGNMNDEIQKVKAKISSGDIVIVYSQAKNDVTLVRKEEFKKK